MLKINIRFEEQCTRLCVKFKFWVNDLWLKFKLKIAC
jgi:hypothetical protein